MLVVVLILLSLAAIAEMLATRYIADLRRHVQQRRQLVQQRLNPLTPVTRPQTHHLFRTRP